MTVPVPLLLFGAVVSTVKKKKIPSILRSFGKLQVVKSPNSLCETSTLTPRSAKPEFSSLKTREGLNSAVCKNKTSKTNNVRSYKATLENFSSLPTKSQKSWYKKCHLHHPPFIIKIVGGFHHHGDSMGFQPSMGANGWIPTGVGSESQRPLRQLLQMLRALVTSAAWCAALDLLRGAAARCWPRHLGSEVLSRRGGLGEIN